MTDVKTASQRHIHSMFRIVAEQVCHPGATKLKSGATRKEESQEGRKNCVQVDPGVAPRGRASATPKQGKRLHPLGVRFSAAELEVVKRKARNAGCTVNSYIRASALGSDYKVPVHQELRLSLLASNRELTALGRNINQIARQLNSGASPLAIHPIGSIQTAVLETLAIVRAALAGRPS